MNDMGIHILGVIAVIVLAVAIALILFAVQLSKHTFKCKSCGFETKYSWKKLIFVTHAYNEYNIACPHCKCKPMIEK